MIDDRRAAIARTDVTTPDINPLSRDRVIFVRRHFLRAFLSRDDATRDTRASALAVHMHERTTRCAICRRHFERRRN